MLARTAPNSSPTLQGWLKRKPKDVDYQDGAAWCSASSWKAPAKLYYTLEDHGAGGQIPPEGLRRHPPGQKELFTDQAVKDWAKSVGIDVGQVQRACTTPSASTPKLQRSAAMGKDYGVQFTPAIAVNGKYWTGPSMVTQPRGRARLPPFLQASWTSSSTWSAAKPASKKGKSKS